MNKKSTDNTKTIFTSEPLYRCKYEGTLRVHGLGAKFICGDVTSVLVHKSDLPLGVMPSFRLRITKSPHPRAMRIYLNRLNLLISWGRTKEGCDRSLYHVLSEAFRCSKLNLTKTPKRFYARIVK